MATEFAEGRYSPFVGTVLLVGMKLAAVLVPVVVTAWLPKLGAILVPAMAAEALTSALTTAPSAIIADVTVPVLPSFR